MKAQLIAQNAGNPFDSVARQTFAHLQAWDISVIKEYVVMKGLYSAENVEPAEVEYKKYLALCAAFPKQAFLAPPELDELWHQHILFTENYAAMCRSVFGHFVHHVPFTGERRADPLAQSRLRELYQLEFGEEPSTMWFGNGLCVPNPNCEGKSGEAI